MFFKSKKVKLTDKEIEHMKRQFLPKKTLLNKIDFEQTCNKLIDYFNNGLAKYSKGNNEFTCVPLKFNDIKHLVYDCFITDYLLRKVLKTLKNQGKIEKVRFKRDNYQNLEDSYWVLNRSAFFTPNE